MPLPRAEQQRRRADALGLPLCSAPCEQPRGSGDRHVVSASPRFRVPAPVTAVPPLPDPAFSGLKEEVSQIRQQLETMALSQTAMQGLVQEVRDLINSGAEWGHRHRETLSSEAEDKVCRPSVRQSRRVSYTANSRFSRTLGADPIFAGMQSPGRRGSDLPAATKKQLTKMDSDLPKRECSKAHIGPSEEEERHMLKTMFEDAEAEEARDLAKALAKRHLLKYYRDALRNLTQEQAEMGLDSIMGFIICVNSVFIGISMDMETDDWGWITANIFFSTSFLLEIVMKTCFHGPRRHFCGSGRFMNMFDFFLVVTDWMQLTLTFVQINNSTFPSATLFRLIRLIKLTRLIRLLRTEIFRDLLSMIQGMMGGLTTLVWAMILFFLTIYMVSLLFREFFGRQETPVVYAMFSSVPRAMFTTFRCSFGDCSNPDGIPIFEEVHRLYGTKSTMLYCCFVFAISIGLFNVISAIFVESTMAAAMSLESTKRKARLQDRHLWNTRITTLIERLMDLSPEHTIPGKMSEHIDEIFAVDVPAEVIDLVVHDPDAIHALNDLDIDREDHAYLSDILDPDNGGSIRVFELIDGLRRLRGAPRRSDIVSVDLMIRSIQVQIGDIQSKVDALFEDLPMPMQDPFSPRA